MVGKCEACILVMSNKLRLAILTCTHLLGIPILIVMILYYIFSVDLFLSQWVTSCWEAVPQWQAGGTDTTISPGRRRRTTPVKLIAQTPVLINYSKNLTYLP